MIAGGDAGAAKAVQIVRDEINKILAQIGCPVLRDCGPDFLCRDQEGRNVRP